MDTNTKPASQPTKNPDPPSVDDLSDRLMAVGVVGLLLYAVHFAAGMFLFDPDIVFLTLAGHLGVLVGISLSAAVLTFSERRRR